MKFFLDTANLDELKKATVWGIVDGVTTNPSLIAKEGNAMDDQIRRICEIVDGDVSAAVVSTDSRGMISEGRRLAKIHRNVVVKVPLTRDGITACSELDQRRHPVECDAMLLGGAGDAGCQGGRLYCEPFRRKD